MVLGGYGGFGGRLSRRLAAAGHDVIVAGRNLDRAAAFCRSAPNCRPAQADRRQDLRPILAHFRPALLIDAAGPFQNSGYGAAQACIGSGVPYLDLADAREFVAGIHALDASAREANIPVIAGASSVPALSGAVARRLAVGMDRVTAVEMAISASNRAAAGASVATAILSYVGRPIRLWRGRRQALGHGWQEMRAEEFALNDGTKLGHRLVALADVPDLDLLPDRLPGRPAVSFRAGTELGFQNRLLWLASWLVRWRWISSLSAFGGLLRPAQKLTSRFGSARSAMVVRLFGFSGPQRLERRWTLVADHDHGPEIPSLAAALLAERILGGMVAPGARDAGAELELTDFQPSFDGLSIRHEISDFIQAEPLYARVMKARFYELPSAVAAMHSVLRDDGSSGRASVSGGTNLAARFVAALMRFPKVGDHDLHVAFSERNGVEWWTRDFSGRRFTSRLSKNGRYLVERFGPLRFCFDLVSEPNGLVMVMRRWSCAGVPLPLILAPRSEAREWEGDGRFFFDVPIEIPIVGKIVHYRGWLRPVP